LQIWMVKLLEGFRTSSSYHPGAARFWRGATNLRHDGQPMR